MTNPATAMGGARRLLLALGAGALTLVLAACSGGGPVASGEPVGSSPPDVGGVTPSDEFIPTFPPDDLASGTAACIDEPTMGIIDQLRDPEADVASILAANKGALLEGLADLESADPKTVEWRDALLTALSADDMAAAAAAVAVLVAGDLTITPC